MAANRVCALSVYMPTFLATPFAWILIVPFEAGGLLLEHVTLGALSHTTWAVVIMFLSVVFGYLDGKECDRTLLASWLVLVLALLA